MYERIVCLTEETTEALYLMGEDWRIVGISGFTVRPPRARKEKPKVSAFTSAKIDKIIDLKPDLVLGFSDIFNHRSVQGILNMIRILGSMIGCTEKGDKLAEELEAGLAETKMQADMLSVRPRVYFEEWYDPLISGIRWVSELIEQAGGEDCFPELAVSSLAKNRIVTDPEEVVRRSPDIIIGSWCGRKFRKEKLVARPGWDKIPAVQSDDVYEIKSTIILQPGPAALTDGVNKIHDIIDGWAKKHENIKPSVSGG